MQLVLDDTPPIPPIARWRSLPPRMRVLYITTYHRTGGWLAEAFASDRAVDVVLEEAVGLAAGLARLRDEVFDAVLVSHEPGDLDALELLGGLRASGSVQPLIVLGTQSEQELAPLCFEVGADAYVCVNTCTTRTLLWIVARAYEHQRLRRENQRLAQAEQHRLRLEHHEANRLLEQQRAIIRQLDDCQPDDSAPRDEQSGGPWQGSGDAMATETSDDQQLTVPPASEPVLRLPPSLLQHYRELLRTYVIMGSGNLSDEMVALAEVLAAAEVSSQQTVQLHLAVLEELLRGLGARSARHVIMRADLLILEVLVHLVENYRERAYRREHPPEQLLLPGF